MVNDLNLSLVLTQSASNQIKEIWNYSNEENNISMAEEILKEQLSDEVYDCYLQNASLKTYKKERIRILIASDTITSSNLQFIIKNNNKIISIEGINEDRSFVVTNIRLVPKNIANMSSKSIPIRIRFYLGYNIKATTIPTEILENVYKMPNVSELYKKIDKNMKDWDNYLSIIEENARKSQLEIKYNGYKQDDSLIYCTFYFDNFTNEQIDKLNNFRHERVVLFYNYNNTTYEDFIGKILKIDYKQNSISIDLEPEFQELASQGQLDFPEDGNLRISKMGDLAQARNLRRGLFLLKSGQSKNANLDMILFETENISEDKTSNFKIQDNDLLIKTLNEKQRKAVEGVLNSNNIFLIQGPPGTGKTTVIAEICYQYAIRGKKILISSQSNLAVDNALSKLKDNPNVKVLRKGNLSSVEKEGEQYTEVNIVDTWLKKTSHICNTNYKEKLKIIEEIKDFNDKYSDIKDVYLKLNEIENSIKDKNEDIKSLESLINKINHTKELLSQKLKFIDFELDNCTNIKSDNNTLIKELENIKKLLKQDVFNSILDNNIMNVDVNKILNYIKEFTLDMNLNKKNIIHNSKDIEKIEVVKKLLKEGDISNIKNNLSKDIEYGKELKKYLVLLEDKDYEYNDLKYKIIVLKKTSIKLRNHLEKLTYLKDKYNIQHRLYKTESYNIKNFNDIKDFENELDNLLKSSKIWSNEIINFIKKCNICIEYLNTQIEVLEKNSEIYICNIDFYKQQISSLLTDLEYKFIESKSIIENELNQKNFQILTIKSSLDSIKNILISNINELYYGYNTSLLQEKSNLSIKIEEKNNLQIEVNKYNEQIKSITSKDISIEDDYRDELNIKKELINKELVLISEWINAIEDKKYANKNELRDLYIELANVIGITCVQSANKEFTETYPEFDLVIIDEVSKATPPELILPMLKGKQFVLVGDHKQLPPMIGNETFEELKQHNENEINSCDISNNAEYEDNDLEYMKESLFERLYREVNDSNKVMLNVQYRMHSSIMDTINQFYNDDGSKGLICGDLEENVTKEHNIKTGYINDKNHLLWVDMPMHKKFYEELDEKNSFYNEAEIEIIEKIIEDINSNCDDLNKKEIAVITFYGAQAKKLQNRLIGNSKYNNVIIRVGTVDRFQGMESEIVIVSFVRNNGYGNVGFARDSKRINVALSRAKKLLIIVGCSELFCDKNKHINARESYSRVLNIVRNNDGIRDANEILNYRREY